MVYTIGGSRWATAVGVLLFLAWGTTAQVSAQSQHTGRHGLEREETSLEEQLADIKAQLEQLQAAVEHGHRADATPRSGEKDTGMAADETMAPRMTMMGSQDEPGAGRERMEMGMMRERMGMMGKMMERPALTSALPGFPGATRIYHVGSTDFFLDHVEHLALSAEQQRNLNAMKDEAEAGKATVGREIEQAEQELWQLTGSDEPDAVEIEVKVREIEKLKGDQRLDFIRAVGRAAGVLTDAQRRRLMGLDDASH